MRKLFLIILFVALSACSEQKEEPLMNLDEFSRNIDTSKLQRDFEFQKVQDSILKNYSSAIKIINQIDSELSKIAVAPQSKETYSLEMEILQKIDYLSFQLKSRNEDITKLEIRLKSLGKENKEYFEKIKTLESIIAEKDVIIENQNKRIMKLEYELAATKTELDLTRSEKIQIEEKANQFEIEKNTAYYIIGKEKDLKNRNIIKMEGEGFLGIGGRYVPSTDADLKEFTKLNISSDTLLAIPEKVKKIEIISTHSRRLLEFVKYETGNDYLKVINPDLFWKTDKMLIIIFE